MQEPGDFVQISQSSVVTAWVVRAGSSGENEDLDLANGLVTIGWSELGDLGQFEDKEALRKALSAYHAEANVAKIANWTGQIWSFAKNIQLGDLAVLPLKRRAALAIGRVASAYEFRPEFVASDAVHTRKVEWLRTDIARTAVDQDLLYSIGAIMTVFRVERNNAVKRLSALAQASPAADAAAAVGLKPVSNAHVSEQSEAAPDLERTGRDLIATTIGMRFKGHDLERLVEAVLIADGFRVDRTRAGADGGVDLLAGRGGLGFDSPRICVQVKSSQYPEDVKPIRELQGALKNFGADHGLFVSWGGFKSSVYTEGRRSFFEIRLWTADDLIDAVLRLYDKLPASLRTELPIKRIWAPASTDELA